VLETWDWYIYRFWDKAVFDVIDESRRIPPRPGPAWLNLQPTEVPYSPEEIAKRLARSVDSVSKSLERLQSNKKAVRMRGGWYSAELAKRRS